MKGTIVSLFNEKTPLGKNYVFDIRRTCREVYDHTRRVLHQLDQGDQRTVSMCKQGQVNVPFSDVNGLSKYSTSESSDDCTLEDHGSIDLILASDSTACKGGIAVDEGKCVKNSCLEVKKKLSALQDSLLCRICMDADVCTAFFPCRHVVCCNNCSRLCDSCPICRSPVQASQKIYLPVSSCGKNVTLSNNQLHHHHHHHHHHQLEHHNINHRNITGDDDSDATLTTITTSTGTSGNSFSRSCVQQSTSEPNENAQNSFK